MFYLFKLMSYEETEVKIINRLTKVFDGVEIIFYIDENIDINNIKEVESSITLDIVYLKKNIKLGNKITKEKNSIKVSIERFPLEQENETNLMNVATLNFNFIDKNKNVVLERKLITQIFREKSDIFKNII